MPVAWARGFFFFGFKYCMSGYAVLETQGWTFRPMSFGFTVYPFEYTVFLWLQILSQPVGFWGKGKQFITGVFFDKSCRYPWRYTSRAVNGLETRWNGGWVAHGAFSMNRSTVSTLMRYVQCSSYWLFFPRTIFFFVFPWFCFHFCVLHSPSTVFIVYELLAFSVSSAILCVALFLTLSDATRLSRVHFTPN